MNAKKTWIAAAILCGTMAIGIGIGSAGTLLVLKASFKHRQPDATHRMDTRKEKARDFMLQKMQRTLELSDDQVVAVRKELNRMAADFGTLHEKAREEVDQITVRGYKAIKQHLTDQQVEVFEEKFGKRRKFGFPHDRDGRGMDRKDRGGPPMPAPGEDFGPPPGEMGTPPPEDMHPPQSPESDPNA